MEKKGNWTSQYVFYSVHWFFTQPIPSSAAVTFIYKQSPYTRSIQREALVNVYANVSIKIRTHTTRENEKKKMNEADKTYNILPNNVILFEQILVGIVRVKL